MWGQTMCAGGPPKFVFNLAKPQVCPRPGRKLRNLPKFFAKCSPNLPKIDQRSSQKAFWNPSWTHISKNIHFECAQNGQDAPGSGPKRFQTAPSPSQIEPQICWNPIFGRFSGIQYHIFNWLGFSIKISSILNKIWTPRPLKSIGFSKAKRDF